MTTMRLLDNVFSVRTDESDHPQNLGELNCLQCLIYGRSAEELFTKLYRKTKPKVQAYTASNLTFESSFLTILIIIVFLLVFLRFVERIRTALLVPN